MTREQFIIQVKNHEKSFRRFLMALCCGDSALADDIAQQSYIKAYLSVENLENPDKFRYWLYRIGHNTFLSHKRSEKLMVGYEEVREMQSESASDCNFKYQELHLALNRLPLKERIAILLYYMEGYSIKEISGIVDSSEDSVRQQMSRGRKHLKEYLKID
ncbi:MAG: RNA polymerase sigma factor [Muribaculaceae bacterium]|nr:RNA polymerase sigma factor [Muribaculaceae bacterium]